MTVNILLRDFLPMCVMHLSCDRLIGIHFMFVPFYVVYVSSHVIQAREVWAGKLGLATQTLICEKMSQK